MNKIVTVSSGIFIAMVSLRAIMSLILPKLHSRITARFYRQGGKSKHLYMVLFLLAAGLMVWETSITGFILALMTIGFLYDYLFALFPEESEKIVEKGQQDKKRLWLFAYVVPLGSAVWFLLSRFA